jgi:hypothetical protein
MFADSTRRLAEAAGVAALGAAFAGAAGAALGAAVPAAIIGGANGAISGWRRIYDWSCSNGLVAFTLDSTWSLPMTGAGLFANTVGLIQRDSGYVPELSERSNRHVYRRGFMPRKGFAITLGNVIGGAADIERPRRAKLITDHEDVHVWQARWFGPFYPLLYGGWMLLGGAVGAVRWVADRRRKGDRLFATVESAAYFLNPFEWWAYSRDDYWPPSGKVANFGWQRPCCAPFAIARPDRPSGLPPHVR